MMSASGFMIVRGLRALTVSSGEVHLKIAGIGFFFMGFLFFLFLFLRAGSSPDSWFAKQRSHDLVCAIGSLIFVLMGLVFLFAGGLPSKILGMASIILFAILGKTTDSILKKLEAYALKWQDNLQNQV